MPTVSGYPVDFPDIQTVDGTRNRGGYCTVADVRQLFLNADAASKAMTNTQLIETLIADVAQDLDRALDLSYITPITGTNSIEHLRFANKHMAAAAFCDMLAMNTNEDPEVHIKASIVHHDKGSQRLDDICSGETQLFDAQVKIGGQKPSFPIGKGSGWNTDVDTTGIFFDPNAGAPLFGVRDDPAQRSDDWIP